MRRHPCVHETIPRASIVKWGYGLESGTVGGGNDCACQLSHTVPSHLEVFCSLLLLLFLFILITASWYGHYSSLWQAEKLRLWRAHPKSQSDSEQSQDPKCCTPYTKPHSFTPPCNWDSAEPSLPGLYPRIPSLDLSKFISKSKLKLAEWGAGGTQEGVSAQCALGLGHTFCPGAQGPLPWSWWHDEPTASPVSELGAHAHRYTSRLTSKW